MRTTRADVRFFSPSLLPPPFFDSFSTSSSTLSFLSTLLQHPFELGNVSAERSRKDTYTYFLTCSFDRDERFVSDRLFKLPFPPFSFIFLKLLRGEVICPYTNRECFLSALLRNFGFENVSSKRKERVEINLVRHSFKNQYFPRV